MYFGKYTNHSPSIGAIIILHRHYIRCNGIYIEDITEQKYLYRSGIKYELNISNSKSKFNGI